LSTLEISANAVITISIWLAARNHVYTWPTGIVGCALFSVVFLRNQLYADATLQLFFIATCVIGWWQWFHPTSPTLSGERPITRSMPRTIVWMVIAGIAVTACYGGLLHRFTNAFMPYMDAAVLALSVIAQCLQMQRKLETWPFWLGVNTDGGAGRRHELSHWPPPCMDEWIGSLKNPLIWGWWSASSHRCIWGTNG
jgi:nicotinamide mononucleotide transporter